MNKNAIIALIDGSATATEAISDYAALFEEELRLNKCDGYADILQPMKSGVAAFIANALQWKVDRWGHVTYARLADDETFPPSQVRIKVVKELQFLSEFMSKPADIFQVERRISISKYAIDALKKKAALGPALLSHLKTSELNDVAAQHLDDLGLGGRESQIKEGSIFGFCDPAVFTPNLRTNVRLVKRMVARAESTGETRLLRADLVLWGLIPSVIDALTRVNRCRRGRHVNLRDLRRRLDEEGRQNLASCARQAARLLEIAFHMTDYQESNQSGETIESWLFPFPLSRFIVAVFETFAPAVDRKLSDGIKIAKTIIRSTNEIPAEGITDPLTKAALDLAENGYDCARRIISLIPQLNGIDLDVGAALMETSKNEQKRM